MQKFKHFFFKKNYADFPLSIVCDQVLPLIRSPSVICEILLWCVDVDCDFLTECIVVVFQVGVNRHRNSFIVISCSFVTTMLFS